MPQHTGRPAETGPAHRRTGFPCWYEAFTGPRPKFVRAPEDDDAGARRSHSRAPHRTSKEPS